MTTIEFDSFDEANRIMQEAEARANASVCTKQRSIVYGSYWVRAEGTMLEYGRVLPQEVAERNLPRSEVQAMRDRYARGYRYSWAASVLGPEGSFGNSHIAVLWPITEEEFLKAQEQDWQLTYAEWQTNMLRRVIEEQRQAHDEARPPTPGSPQEGS